MITIDTLVFNPFGLNTYILYDEMLEAVIIDPGCCDDSENGILADHLKTRGLKPVRLVNTHCHIDHILGNRFVFETYGLLPEYHSDEKWNMQAADIFAENFGVKEPGSPVAKVFLSDGDEIKFGHSLLKVFFTPGHAAGHICLYAASDNILISGDVLFHGSIGRSDLPGGNHAVLLESIRLKLYTLPDEVKAYPGHGPYTTIGYEKKNNPYVNA